MQQYTATFDVTQEAITKTVAFMRPFNQTRNISEDKFASVNADDAAPAGSNALVGWVAADPRPKFERAVAARYLRARKGERFVSIIAVFSLVGIALGVLPPELVQAMPERVFGAKWNEALVKQVLDRLPVP